MCRYFYCVLTFTHLDPGLEQLQSVVVLSFFKDGNNGFDKCIKGFLGVQEKVNI